MGLAFLKEKCKAVYFLISKNAVWGMDSSLGS